MGIASKGSTMNGYFAHYIQTGAMRFICLGSKERLLLAKGWEPGGGRKRNQRCYWHEWARSIYGRSRRSDFLNQCSVITVFDLFDRNGIALAASGLCKMVYHLTALEARCNGRPSLDQPEMLLGLEKYHLKPISMFFSVYGPDKVDKSLVRLFEITRTHLESASFACCPIAYRVGDKSREDAIVFENLSEYCIGLPSESTAERQKLLVVIKKALDELHKTGLVHMDLYLSNIMWYKNPNSGVYHVRFADLDGVYHVRFVDFDGVHFAGQRLSDAMAHRLQELGFSEEWLARGAHPSVDHHYLGYVEQNIDSNELFHQPDQAATIRSLDSFLQRQPVRP